VLLLTACGPVGDGDDSGTSGSGGAVRDGGTITVALADDPDMLDPTLARTLVGRMVFMSMCEKLYDIDQKLNVVPQLAASPPTISQDGRSAEIKLRQGVRFNDDTPLDAEAVKKSLDRHRTLEGSQRKSELLAVTGSTWSTRRRSGSGCRSRSRRCKWSGAGRFGRVLALGFLGQLVEEGLGAGSLLPVDGGERVRDFFGRLARLDDGAVGPDGRPDDQGEREGVAWPGVNLGGALWAVDHDDRVVGAFAEAVDADLAQAATEGLDQASGQVGTERSRELRAVA
jgi:hypothetical protein